MIYCFRFLSWLLCLLPRRVHVALGALIGFGIRISNPKRQRIVHQYLQQLFPQKSEQLAKANARHLGLQLIDFLMWPYWAHRLKKWVITDDAFKAMVQTKQPIYLTAHIGNWEILPPFTASFGKKAHCVYKKGQDRHHGLWSLRQHPNITMWEAQSQLKQLLYALKEDGALGLVSDHGQGITVPFFEQAINLPLGAFKLAARSKRGVYFLWAQSLGTRYRMHTVPLVQPGEKASYDVIAHAYVKALMNAIKVAPEQYYWRVDPWRQFQPHSVEQQT